MRVFVTGASGWIGSAVVPALLSAGHEVTGLARSPRSAEAVAALGAHVHHGSLEDVASLEAGARAADGVVHLGYHHDFSQMAEAAELDRRAIGVFADVLAGTNGPLVVAAGVVGIAAPGQLATEAQWPDAAIHPRAATGRYVVELAGRGVRASLLRLPPTVHGTGDHGFIATLSELARRTGVAGYVDEGTNRWSAVHRDDAAALVRLAVESAEPGTVLHAVGEEGIATREIAEALGRSLDVPARSVPASAAAEHFGWIGAFFGMDAAASSERTREGLGWTPAGPGLLADIEAGGYAAVTPHSTVGG